MRHCPVWQGRRGADGGVRLVAVLLGEVRQAWLDMAPCVCVLEGSVRQAGLGSVWFAGVLVVHDMARQSRYGWVLSGSVRQGIFFIT